MTKRTGTEHRLSLLDAYGIMDTPAEQAFDDVALIAAQLCGTPVALVSLVGDDRQWFKARVGFDASETPISQSVCANDLDQPGILEIPDLTQDLRTAANPLVSGPPHARFYAGAPLIAPDGTAIGRLCVIDAQPRPGGLDDGQRRSLEALARLVMTQMALRDAAQVSDAVHEASRMGTFEVDVPAGTVVVSKEFCEIYGLPPAPRYPAAAIEALVMPADRALASSLMTRNDGSAERDTEYRIRRADDGELRWIARRASFVRDDAGRIALMHGTAHDVTERRRLQAQQDVVNHEISHRLKNTLSMVQAIAMQTLRHVPDREPVDAFERRLMALGTAHDILLQDNWRSAELAPAARAVLALLGQAERVAMSGPVVRIGARVALSFALLVHELATNAMKYGALSHESGRVTLDWHIDGDDFVMQWNEHDGPPIVTPPLTKGFGSRLVRAGLLGTGGVHLRYEADGLSAEMRAPLDQVEQI